jgi:pimeloyl-ACP methyl ester carboxylesterase
MSKKLLASFVIGTALVAGCSSSEHFILVHGAWSGGWAWADIVAALQAKGDSAEALDLPAHGADTTPISGATLDAYVSTVGNRVNAASSPVVLVGHSFGGVVITQVAEQYPKKISELVYLAAFVPENGENALALAQTDTGSHLGPVLEINPDAGTAAVPAAKLADVFARIALPTSSPSSRRIIAMSRWRPWRRR